MNLFFLFISFFLFFDLVQSLKCRNTETGYQEQDIEWAVRQCVSQVSRNSSDDPYKSQLDSRPGNQSNGGLFGAAQGWNRPNRDLNRQRDNPEQNGYRGGTGSEPPNPFRPEPRERAPWDSSRYPTRSNRNRPNYEPENDDDYFGQTSEDGRRQRGQNNSPHTNNQQFQHDRDNFNNNKNYFNNNHGKPIFQPNNNFGQNKPYFPNNNNNFNQDKPNSEESRMMNIDPCIIYCIFQELKMLDKWGQVSKHAVMEKMTRNLRDREMSEFIRFTIEDCFSDLDKEDDPNRTTALFGKDIPDKCKGAKTIAICIEERGKETCEDWDDKLTKDQSSPEDISPRPILNTNNRDKDKTKEVKKGLTLNNNRG